MARYIAKERGQIPLHDTAPVRRPDDTGRRVVHRIVEAGEAFEYEGRPGRWMEPVDDDEEGAPRPKASGARGKRSATSNDSSGEQDGNGAP